MPRPHVFELVHLKGQAVLRLGKETLNGNLNKFLEAKKLLICTALQAFPNMFCQANEILAMRSNAASGTMQTMVFFLSPARWFMATIRFSLLKERRLIKKLQFTHLGLVPAGNDLLIQSGNEELL